MRHKLFTIAATGSAVVGWLIIAGYIHGRSSSTGSG